MAQLPVRRLRAILDFGKQFRFGPCPPIWNALTERLLRLLQPIELGTQTGRVRALEPMLDLPRIGQSLAFAAAEKEPVKTALLHFVTGDRQRLALRAGDLGPDARAAALVG